MTDSTVSWEPKPGDVVVLKSGGPKMTISSINQQGAIFTHWFDGSAVQLHAFQFEELKPSEDPPLRYQRVPFV